MNMLIRATSMPQAYREYTSEEIPTKAREILKIIEGNPGEKVAVGCLTIEAAEYYRGLVSQRFP
ncbi:MAG: hypothetical protein GTO45_13535, partial [Candidatus Aminicenantes bacterium]|nr:hypothetical protein [Candidatus Aminicenantes bacterium]NIN19128.1 hypothetical protein [Candidatus Aminicenantes bacterium]NIN43030.1 hypothetical protein [Candidatus Aminicenantes bacterium]NIN85773.1 hypothetical protein [Candidatus Aminicenantes bacterium]NIO82033.1 hypothetical protein [Candidatus Aminicenantes bacterium]